ALVDHLQGRQLSADDAVLAGEIVGARLARRGRRLGLDHAAVDAVQQGIDLVLRQQVGAHYWVTRLVKITASTLSAAPSALSRARTSSRAAACRRSLPARWVSWRASCWPNSSSRRLRIAGRWASSATSVAVSRVTTGTSACRWRTASTSARLTTSEGSSAMYWAGGRVGLAGLASPSAAACCRPCHHHQPPPPAPASTTRIRSHSHSRDLAGLAGCRAGAGAVTNVDSGGGCRRDAIRVPERRRGFDGLLRAPAPAP